MNMPLGMNMDVVMLMTMCQADGSSALVKK